MKFKFAYLLSIPLSIMISCLGFFGCAAANKSNHLTTHARAVDNSPVYGSKNAAVKIVEFTDFECHFCGMVQPALQQALKTYPTQVSLTFKSFPLTMHRHAHMAHMAAMCANEQGRFWEYRNKLFQNQRALERNNLNRYATELGLNLETFSQCIDEEKYADKIEADLSEGLRSGVMGTPTFFVNGKELSGAQPFEAFQEVIEQSLAENK